MNSKSSCKAKLCGLIMTSRGLWLLRSGVADFHNVRGVNCPVRLAYRPNMIGFSTFLGSRHLSVRQHVWPFDLAWGTSLPDVDQQVLSNASNVQKPRNSIFHS